MDDFKQEALRLVSELIDAAHGTVLNEDQSREDETRAALLAHIQRGAVPGGVGAFRHKETGELRYVLIGGQHNEDEWDDVLIVPMLAAAPDHFRDGAEMVAESAEVPMPEPDTHCHDEDERRDVWSHSTDQMRTYGTACRAAGEAAGYARGLKEAGRDAERYRLLRRGQKWSVINGVGDCLRADALDAAIDAAPRGEVK